ncbi:hypothetical protein ACFV3R_30755 [Streptomyces sp. NPDC059740]|uniref:hypothetical protein n=1 Tax=Streptomyces sp. NPDC059740 TaxID=3346926 RepID=UPI003658BC1E
MAGGGGPRDAAFVPRTGEERLGTVAGPGRAAALRTAVAGLREVRRLTGAGAGPAAWERNQPLRAVSLVLEAEGCPPSAVDEGGERAATGYRVGPGGEGGAVVVRWSGPHGSGARHEERQRLRECARTLRRWGFEALEVRGPGGRYHLEVEPRG